MPSITWGGRRNWTTCRWSWKCKGTSRSGTNHSSHWQVARLLHKRMLSANCTKSYSLRLKTHLRLMLWTGRPETLISKGKSHSMCRDQTKMIFNRIDLRIKVRTGQSLAHRSHPRDELQPTKMKILITPAECWRLRKSARFVRLISWLGLRSIRWEVSLPECVSWARRMRRRSCKSRRWRKQAQKEDETTDQITLQAHLGQKDEEVLLADRQKESVSPSSRRTAHFWLDACLKSLKGYLWHMVWISNLKMQS